MCQSIKVLFILFSFIFSGYSEKEEVTFVNACKCEGNHWEFRSDVKSEAEAPPDNIPNSHKLKPSDLGNWGRTLDHMHKDTPRSGKEKEWFEITGKVVLLKAEADGELHLQLKDVTGGSPLNLIVEIPLGEKWCKIRQTVLSWADVKFPFHTTSSKSLTLLQNPVITVRGKAFYDGQHATSQADNRRVVKHEITNVMIWEIHPVMYLQIKS